MPFVVKKQKDKYRLWNKDKKAFAKPVYNTRQAALNAKRAYERRNPSYGGK
jgi:hypothetical protein